MPTRRPLALALDEAGRALDEGLQLATLAAIETTPDVNVVLGVRSADPDAVESTFRDVGNLGYRVIVLPALELSHATDLAMLESKTLDEAVAQRIAMYFTRRSTPSFE